MTGAAIDPDRLAAIDAAVRRGEIDPAAAELEQLLAEFAGTAALWLQLAGLRRHLRQPRRALAAVHQALALTPLDFVALAMRAQLIERLEPDAAGEAWHEALLQRPPGELQGPLAAAVSAGEAIRDAWHAARAERLATAIAPAATRAEPDAAWRIERFRTNVLRETRIWHSSPTHFHYPGLIEREFHPRERFPFLEAFEAATPVIRAELQAALANNRAELIPYLEYQEHEALDQWRPLNRNPDWTAFHLIRRGEVNPTNAALCPETMKLLATVPAPDIPGASANALFSMLAPRTAIPPHVGVNNTRLLCHVPLIVPEGGCWFRVGGETRLWREGEAFVFDDTVEHEAMNPTDFLRVVLIFDLWHPDLTQPERDAVAALVAADPA